MWNRSIIDLNKFTLLEENLLLQLCSRSGIDVE